MAKAILFTLEKAAWTGTVLYDFAAYTHHYTNALGTGPNIQRYSFYQAIKRLREQGLIDQVKDIDQDKIILRLTKRGIYHNQIERILSSDKWDGKWRMVIFGIPENKRRLRNTLRQRLKEWGFEYKQKSLWVSKNDIAQPLRNFIKVLGIDKWVVVAVSEDTGLF